MREGGKERGKCVRVRERKEQREGLKEDEEYYLFT